MRRKIALCQEISKKNENVFRGLVEKVLSEISVSKKILRGEFVIIIEGVEKNSLNNLDISTEMQIKKLLKKFSLTEVVEIVHKLTKISKKEIYKTTLLLKND